ncbi:MAG: hypothetical protein FWH42_01620 [Dehalococcoidia bacterium]|nr:hypothetical protein [Dehalococcoidia bacterium]
MNAPLLVILILSLLLTEVLEVVFFLLVGKRSGKDLLVVLLVNLFTNPAVVLAYWWALTYTKWNLLVVIILLELFAVLFEGCYYKCYGHGFKRPFLFSVGANLFSFSIGLFLQML